MKKSYPSRRGGRIGGFTLLEVLLVLAILVILGSLVTYYFVGMQEDAYSDVAKTQIELFEDAITAYKLKVGTYPNQLEDLVQMPSGMTRQKWGGPYLQVGDKVPLDPWDSPYTYTLNQQSASATGAITPDFTIVSYGPNKAPGGGDDISNMPDDQTTGT